MLKNKITTSKQKKCEGFSTYKNAGVDITASENLIHKIYPLMANTARLGSINSLGDFAGIFDITKLKYSNPILTSSCDGVGTKLQLANIANFYDNIGIDLVAMCVNDLLTKGSEPLFFLDYFSTANFNEQRDIAIMKSIAKGCKIANCGFLGGETAQMPNLYQNQDYDLAGFAVGIVEKSELLPKNTLKKGDLVIGLASNGLHANGFSLIHKIIKDNKIDILKTSPFAKNFTYTEFFLQPTRIYNNSILNLLKKFKTIKAIAHITGGGVIQNLPRILPNNLCAELNLSNWPHNGVYEWLAKQLNLDSENMLKIFNCGIGLILIVDCEQSNEIYNYLQQQNETAFIIGTLIENQNKINLTGNIKGIK